MPHPIQPPPPRDALLHTRAVLEHALQDVDRAIDCLDHSDPACRPMAVNRLIGDLVRRLGGLPLDRLADAQMRLSQADATTE